jgi:hypothetical protein
MLLSKLWIYCESLKFLKFSSFTILVHLDVSLFIYLLCCLWLTFWVFGLELDVCMASFSQLMCTFFTGNGSSNLQNMFKYSHVFLKIRFSTPF